MRKTLVLTQFLVNKSLYSFLQKLVFAHSQNLELHVYLRDWRLSRHQKYTNVLAIQGTTCRGEFAFQV
jgi:hypothetical protein